MKKKTMLFMAMLLLLVATASATPMCPGGLTPLPAATWGGSGISNDAVCQQSAGGVTVGVTAHGRYANPAVGNDGVGTFFATAGGDTLSVPSAACPAGVCAQWNWAFYAQNLSNSPVTVTLGWGNGGFFSQVLGAGQTWQDSWNNGFGFIDTGVAIPSTYSPSSVLFDPNTSGTYPFTLSVNGVTGGPIVGVAMDVQVGAVPEPGTFSLLAVAGIALSISTRRWTRRRRHGSRI